MRNNLTRSIFLLIFLPTVACYEDPIRERLLIEFLKEGTARLTLTVEFLDPSGEAESAALLQRLKSVRADYEREHDPWAHRFAGLYRLKDRFVREREEEDLVRIEHVAETTVSAMPRLFDDTNVTVTVIDGRGWREVAFFPATSSRASDAQRIKVSRAMDEWTRAVAAYLRAEERLFRYVELHPHRAIHVIGNVLADLPYRHQIERLQLEDENERALVDEVRGRMEPILSSLVAAEDEAYSLDELSSLVYDPFPADLVVVVPGEILEIEGFERGETTGVAVPELRLWSALESLQDLWITPDLLSAYLRVARGKQETFDLEAFVAQDRRVITIPSVEEIRLAIEQRLARKAVYRVRWTS